MALMLLTALSSISTVGALWLLAELLDAQRLPARIIPLRREITP